MIAQFTEFLRERRSSIVRSATFLKEVYDPTYGLQDPCSETIEVIDFDALCEAMDDFSLTFKGGRD